ncbi:MAG: hypothetical protein AB7O95_13150 [Geminicoccaceae bacterium]
MTDGDGSESDALSLNDVRRLRWELGILSEEDLAAVVGTTVRTLRGWRNKRCGPPWVKVGQIALYRRASITAWLEQLEEHWPHEAPDT